MGTPSEGTPPLYLYGVVRSDLRFPPDRPGVEGRPVERIEHGPLSVLASPLTASKVRPSRANLNAHQEIVGLAHRSGPVLPIRFGTVMPGADAVIEELLGPEVSRFRTLLADFEGMDEYRVRCRYLGDVALREVVARSRPIQRLRSRLAAGGTAGAQGERLRLGELVAAELERLRQADADALLAGLAPHIAAWEPVEESSDEVPLHAALLVERDGAEPLEDALTAMAAAQRDRLQIELVGPLPLWDFSNVATGVA